MKKYIYGVDIGGTNVKLGLFREKTVSLIKTISFKTPKTNQETVLFQKIVKAMVELNKEYNVDFKDVIGVGLTVPCPVVNGVIKKCSNVSLTGIDAINQLNKYLPTKLLVTIANDANMAALGEFRKIKADYKNAVMYTLGTGVGGGIIINKNVLTGNRGAAGEVGHMKVFDGLNTNCGCGSNGCLEQLAGTQAMFDLVSKYSVFTPSILDDKQLSVKAIYDAAKLGDVIANRVVDKSLDAIAISASILAVTVDPDVFIIGGGVANSGQFLIDKLTKHYSKHARFNTNSIPFVLAKLKNTAGMYGAAYYLVEKYKDSKK